MKSSDYFVGTEAEGEHLKECGTPFGNRHTTCIPTVETTLAPTTDNPNKHPRTIESMIHTDANIAHEMEAFQPVCQFDGNPFKVSIRLCE